jgi:hypothetical protein
MGLSNKSEYTRDQYLLDYDQWEKNFPLNSDGNHVVPYYTLEEFAGRFGYTIEKARYEIKWRGIHTTRQIFVKGAPLVIFDLEVDRYAAILEAEKQQEEPPPCNLPPYMNKKHAAYADELEAAVSCWLALYADAAPGTIRLIGRDEISKWLKENRPKAVVSKAALDRVVTIVNPKENKGGGAKPTP